MLCDPVLGSHVCLSTRNVACGWSDWCQCISRPHFIYSTFHFFGGKEILQAFDFFIFSLSIQFSRLTPQSQPLQVLICLPHQPFFQVRDRRNYKTIAILKNVMNSIIFPSLYYLLVTYLLNSILCYSTSLFRHTRDLI